MAAEGIRGLVDCVFCNIAKGFAPAEIVLQDDDFVAFHDLFPKAEQHLLVIPRAHHQDLDAWVGDGGSSDRMLRFASEAAAAAGIGGAYRLLTNVGRDAGQVIFHVHWHVLGGNVVAF